MAFRVLAIDRPVAGTVLVRRRGGFHGHQSRVFAAALVGPAFHNGLGDRVAGEIIRQALSRANASESLSQGMRMDGPMMVGAVVYEAGVIALLLLSVLAILALRGRGG